MRTPAGIEAAAPPAYRYGALPLFAIAVVFIVLAPAYWNETQARSGAVAEAYENADLYHYYYPVYRYAFERLRHGALPLWCPRQHCGTPLLADSNAGIFQPLNLPFLFFSTERALALHAFLCLFLMGLFFALLARAVGVGYLAALLGGMTYAFSGLSASAMARPPLAAALVWTPLLLWAVREYAHRFDTATAVLAGIAGALLIVSGAHAFAAAACALAALYAAQSLVAVERGSAEFAQRARGLLVIAAIALGVSAVQWVPSLVFALRLDDPLDWIWGPRAAGAAPSGLREFLIQVITSAPAAQPRIAYFGVVPLMFAPAALFHRHRRRDAILYALIAAGAIALAVFFQWQPPARFPVSALMLPIAAAVALLTAIGADRVFTPKTSFRSPAVWPPALVTLGVCAALFAAFGAEVRRYLVPCALAVVVFVPFRKRALTPVCFLAIGAVLLVDFVNANRTVYTHPSQDAPGCYAVYADALDAARDRALGGRIVTSAPELDRGLSPNIGLIAAIDIAGGAGIPLTRDQARWWEDLGGAGSKPAHEFAARLTPQSRRPQLLRYMAARLLVAAPQAPMYGGAWDATGPALREVPAVGGVRMFVFDDALARAYWAPGVRVEVGMPATLDALCSPDFDPARTCVVDAQSEGIGALEKLSNAARETGARPNATCSVEDVAPERVVVRVDAPSDGVTVLADTYDPGWSATLDGRRVPILRANGIFRAVATPAGTHEIVFAYRPWSVYAGIAVSLATLLAALALGARALAKKA